MTQIAKILGIWKLSNRCVYGVDANERMARTSKMNMIMHGDGHGGIHHHDGFLNVNGVFENRFDIILTNPPFGQVVDREDEILKSQIEIDEEVIDYYREIYGEDYEKSIEIVQENIGKPILTLFNLPKGTSIKTELLFIERCLNLLKAGGRLAIVLPEGVFNTSSVQYVRNFLEDRAYINAIVSLPQDAFSSSGARVKASLLFATKYTDKEKVKWEKTLIKEVRAKEKKYESIHRELTERLDELKGKEKKEVKDQIKALEEKIFKEGRNEAKVKWDYPIFIHEAVNIGINAQGEDIDQNELPEVFNNYLEHLKKKTLGKDGILERTFVAPYSVTNKWTIPVKLLLDLPNPKGWDLMKVDDLIYKVEDNKEEVEEDQEYNMVGVRWYGEGVFLRETVLGSETSAKQLNRLVNGAFIYNRLFGWKESFAVVTPEFEGCYCSNEFPQFLPKGKKKILTEYLYFLFIQPEFIKAVKVASGGSAAVSRNRFKEEDFLEFEILIPPFEYQLKIVEEYNKSLDNAKELRQKADKIVSASKGEIRNKVIGTK